MENEERNYLKSLLPEDAKTIKEAANLVGVSVHVAYRAKIKHYKIGGKVYVRVSELSDYKRITKSCMKDSIPILVKDLAGNVKRFKSMSEAARYFNTSIVRIKYVSEHDGHFNVNIMADDGMFVGVVNGLLNEKNIHRIISKPITVKKKMLKKKEILQGIIEWLHNDTCYLSTRTDYARGYKDGIEQAKVIVESIINEHNPDLLANN